MKQFILVLALDVVMAFPVFAEDAAVLPAGTLRVDVDASTGFAGKAWDSDGAKTDAPNATIIGAALGAAYGFTGWFTAVFDWSPGVTDTDLTAIDIGNDGDGAAEIYEGLSDFSLKARFQIIGVNAPLQSERFRLRLAPGVIIPFPGIDDKDASGNRAWGAGGEISFDTPVNGNFFVNARSDFYWFPFDNQSKTNKDWELTLEAGPHYRFGIGGASLSLSLPVNWKAASENGGGVSSHLLTLRPAAALKLTRPFTINIEIEYTLPIYGKNSYAVHTVTIKAPMYFNFAKNKNVEE
ncbi:MAG: hypothetical protein LBH18_02150 [Spirochaetaceae bacterium]|jgi:hypothetical protein|nr:hypothetical protein [Spirochaetaceae bacterium]